MHRIGTGPEVFGNTNAPPAVTSSAVIYALRCMVPADIPLNQVLICSDLRSSQLFILAKPCAALHDTGVSHNAAHAKRRVPVQC